MHATKLMWSVAVAVVAATVGVAAADRQVVEGAGFVVSLSTAETAVAGSPVAVTIVLEPRGDYHVNDEYPMSLTIVAPADVSVPKARLGRADATAVGSKRAAFAVAVTPKTAGAKALTFTFKFALCTATTCEPRKQALGFTLRVR